MNSKIPIGITRHEDGSSEVSPITGQECPNCGYEHFWSTSGFTSDWNPKSASQMECDECGAVFKLYAELVNTESDQR